MKITQLLWMGGLTVALAAVVAGCASVPRAKQTLSTEVHSTVPGVELTEAKAWLDGNGWAVSGMLRKTALNAHYVVQAHLHASMVDDRGKVVWETREDLSQWLPISHERLGNVEGSHFVLHLAEGTVPKGSLQLRLHEHAARECAMLAKE